MDRPNHCLNLKIYLITFRQNICEVYNLKLYLGIQHQEILKSMIRLYIHHWELGCTLLFFLSLRIKKVPIPIINSYANIYRKNHS